jgi:hypothetical protein
MKDLSTHSIAIGGANGEIKLLSHDDYTLLRSFEARSDVFSSLLQLNGKIPCGKKFKHILNYKILKS